MRRFLDNAGVKDDDEARMFSDEVINTRTVITFQGTTVDEV